MDYRTARSGDGCGDWCMQQSVRAVGDIGSITSSVVEHAIQLQNRSSQIVANLLDVDASLLHSTVV